jgi:hypothetical protein
MGVHARSIRNLCLALAFALCVALWLALGAAAT